MKQQERGFGTIGVIVILAILCTIGFAGWKVWNNSKTEPTNKQARPTMNTSRETKRDDKNTIPNNFQTYTNKNLGFSVSYPNTWSAPSEDVSGYKIAVTGQKIGSALLTEDASIAIYDKSNFELVAEKYGRTVKPVMKNGAYQWEVVAVNPAYNGDATVGSTFTPPVLKSRDGTVTYDFTFSDEGALYGRVVFAAKDKFITVELPQLFKPDMELTTPEEQQQYNQLIKEIAATVAVVK